MIHEIKPSLSLPSSREPLFRTVIIFFLPFGRLQEERLPRGPVLPRHRSGGRGEEANTNKLYSSTPLCFGTGSNLFFLLAEFNMWSGAPS